MFIVVILVIIILVSTTSFWVLMIVIVSCVVIIRQSDSHSHIAIKIGKKTTTKIHHVLIRFQFGLHFIFLDDFSFLFERIYFLFSSLNNNNNLKFDFNFIIIFSVVEK